MTNNRKYNWENIRNLLIQGFSEGELKNICYRPEFKGLQDILSKNFSSNEVVDALNKYAERYMVVTELLSWAREQNPKRYMYHAPYIQNNLKDNFLDLKDFVTHDTYYISIYQRKKLLEKIYQPLTNNPHPACLVITGYPQIGKTVFLETLHGNNVQKTNFQPILLRGNILTSTNDKNLLGGFIYRFYQFMSREGFNQILYNRFTENNSNPITLFYERWEEYREGKGKWLILFDEIEFLLNIQTPVNELVADFIMGFIQKYGSNLFVFAIPTLIPINTFEQNGLKQFFQFLKRGQSFTIECYTPQETRTMIAKLFEVYFNHPDEKMVFALERFCGGYPAIITYIFKAIQERRQTGKKLEQKDLTPIIRRVVLRSKDIWLKLEKDLNKNEKDVIASITPLIEDLEDIIITSRPFQFSLLQIINKKDPNEVSNHVELIYYLRQGIENLVKREWIHWENERAGLFYFKFGIILLWFKYFLNK